MTERAWLNGYDCFMQSLDWELRRDGFAGFASQMILEIEGDLSADELRESAERRVAQYPVLNARMRRALPRLYPYWAFEPRARAGYPEIRTHRGAQNDDDPDQAAALLMEIFNRPLDARRGELLRFDLVDRRDHGRTDLVMTWHHPLMDSHGAEQLLALIARPELAGPDPWREDEDFAGSYTRRLLTKKTYGERWAEARRSLTNISAASRPLPVSLYTSRREKATRRQAYRIVDFSADETETIAANSKQICGALRTSDYYLWATLAEIDALHARLGVASEAYVVTLPVGMRPKGAAGPIFSTQESTLFFNVPAQAIEDRDKTLASLRAQTTQAFRENLLPAYLYGMELSRPFPAWLFMKFSRRAMQGELGSFFFANTQRAPAELTEFLGRPIAEFTHAPAVAAPPGIGIFFYRFAGRLKCTIVYVEGMLGAGEVRTLAEGLKRRLLAPDETTDG